MSSPIVEEKTQKFIKKYAHGYIDEFIFAFEDCLTTVREETMVEQWELMRNDMLGWLKERRALEISVLESSKLVPDRHYHKGKIHLINDIIDTALLQEKLNANQKK